MAFRFTEKAQRDFDTLAADTEEKWGLQQAIDYTAELIESCELLAEFPHKGRVDSTVDNEEIRRFPLKYHLILYRIVGDDIEILAIPHGRKNPNNYLSH